MDEITPTRKQIEQAADEIRWFKKKLPGRTVDGDRTWAEVLDEDVNLLRDLALRALDARPQRVRGWMGETGGQPDDSEREPAAPSPVSEVESFTNTATQVSTTACIGNHPPRSPIAEVEALLNTTRGDGNVEPLVQLALELARRLDECLRKQA